jgi:hypothetical protein
MRTELHESPKKPHVTPPHRGAKRDAQLLEPLAVDAAMEDEALSVVTERPSRRDPGHALSAPAGDAALLESLADQLDMLHEQQRQIRSLLNRAGRKRLDRANS